LKSRNCKNKLLIKGPEIIANPIDVKKAPKVAPLFVGIAMSNTVAVITGGKKARTIPCKVRSVKSELIVDNIPKNKNESD
jgi:hypothetical protein